MKPYTLRCLEDLRRALEEDPRAMRLSDAEKRLCEAKGLKALVDEKNARNEDYLRLRLERGEEDAETVEAKRLLREAKLRLDLEPICREYTLCHGEWSHVLRQVDDVLFHDFREKSRCGGTHD